MKRHTSQPAPGATRRRTSAFTLVEMLMATGVTGLILGVALVFTTFASVNISGITSQSNLNDKAANALQMIQDHARVATLVSNNASGTILTLGFDNDYLVDSDGDTIAYNDANRFETFAIVGTSTDILNSTNKLVFTNTNGVSNTLVSQGVVNFPGNKYFLVTNKATALIRFSVVDNFSLDRYQTVDIQSTAVLLNRRSTTNLIAILP